MPRGGVKSFRSPGTPSRRADEASTVHHPPHYPSEHNVQTGVGVHPTADQSSSGRWSGKWTSTRGSGHRSDQSDFPSGPRTPNLSSIVLTDPGWSRVSEESSVSDLKHRIGV